MQHEPPHPSPLYAKRSARPVRHLERSRRRRRRISPGRLPDAGDRRRLFCRPELLRRRLPTRQDSSWDSIFCTPITSAAAAISVMPATPSAPATGAAASAVSWSATASTRPPGWASGSCSSTPFRRDQIPRPGASTKAWDSSSSASSPAASVCQTEATRIFAPIISPCPAASRTKRKPSRHVSPAHRSFARSGNALYKDRTQPRKRLRFSPPKAAPCWFRSAPTLVRTFPHPNYSHVAATGPQASPPAGLCFSYGAFYSALGSGKRMALT